MRLAAMLLAGLAFMAGPLPASAQQTTDVRFAAGTSGATIEGRIKGYEYRLYRLGAEAGQQMTIRMTADNGAAYFNLYAPGQGPGGEALAVSEMTGPDVPEINLYDAILPQSGTYTVSVYLYRSAARRNETANYTLDIAISGKTGDVVQGDFADGLQGGPDFWRVTAAGGLNLRAEPSRQAPVIIRLPDGLQLRNLGCRMAEGGRWCRVATLADPGFEGWVSADYLAEGSAEAATQLPDLLPVGDDALVAGTGYNATGKVECYPEPGAAMQMCDFGVIRDGNGTGTVTVTLPDGRTRSIFYDGGLPVSFDKSQADGDIAFEAKKVADGYMVFIGPASFTIPDAVIYGG